MMEILFIIFIIPVILLSIIFHEYSHGWMAYKLGDPTPKDSGRLTFNPLAHIDLFGTIILPLISAFVFGFIFGYAKPVPINPYHFKNPRKDIMYVGLAGPAANIIIAALLVLLFKLPIPALQELLIPAIILNLILAIVNLMPIPPLDGSKVFAFFLPNDLAYKYLRIGTYGLFILYFLVLSGFFFRFVRIIIVFLFRYLLNLNIEAM